VANALPEVRQQADYVSPYSNDQSAVARALEELALGF
jgi:hydroxymethylpyrimidine pyrophosphatase-like HAD family hydrolase